MFPDFKVPCFYETMPMSLANENKYQTIKINILCRNITFRVKGFKVFQLILKS